MLMESNSSLWPESGELFEIAGVEIELDESEHPLMIARRAEIEANWELEYAANPQLFNGELLLHRDLRLDADGKIRGVAHLAPYASVLWWRKQAERPIAEHFFSIAVPITRDGALLAIRMADHTANAGRVYCAAGSLDAHDIVGGTVDPVHNLFREVAEETGIDLGKAMPRPGYYAVRINRAVTVFRIFDLDFDAKDAVQHILAHMEQDHEKEIAEPVIIRDAETEGRNYASFMPPIIDLIFAKS